jgi:predicted permease
MPGSVANDIRYGARMLRRSPGFSAVAILSLGLGIGANTAIFSLIDQVLLKMLPVKEPERLVVFHWGGASFTYNQYRRLHDDARLFSGVLGYSPVRLNLSIGGELQPPGGGHLVTGNYFSILGVNAILGRVITPEDDRVPGAHRVAVISYGYWKRRFAMEPGVLNRDIHIAGIPFTIIGVTPPEFFGAEVGSAPDIFVPVMMQPQVMPGVPSWLNDERQINNWLHVLGRLNPGVTIPQATDSLRTVGEQFSVEMNALNKRKFPKLGDLKAQKLELTPGGKGLSELRRQFSQPLLILMGVVGLVLLIACANVANLLLARAVARQKEVTVRIALGAKRSRLVRQLLTESVMLSTLGGAAGLLFSRWVAGALLAFLPDTGIPLHIDLSPDLRVLGFTIAISLATGVLFGLAPALRATNVSLAPALAGTGVKPGQTRVGKALVIAQVSVSALLLVGAGLFVRTFQNLRNVNTGFATGRVLSVRVEPVRSDQKTPQLGQQYQGLLQRVAALPGVRAASMAGFGPISRSPWERGQSLQSSNPMVIDGFTNSGETVTLPWMQIYPDYFKTMGIAMVAGRDFAPGDSAGQKEVAIINESLVRTYFPDRNPIGERIGFAGRALIGWIEVVGVVKDARYGSLRDAPVPMFYLPFAQAHTGRGQMTLHVRTTGDPIGVARAVRSEAQGISGGAPMFEIQTLAAQVSASLIEERMIATLCGSFGALALMLVSIGVYGIMAYSVTRRTNEIGLRMALGARPSDVTWLVLRETLLLAGAGLAIGLTSSVSVARLISNRLFGLSASDPVTMGTAAMVMIAIALLAGYLPARRAARVEPMSTLRYE